MKVVAAIDSFKGSLSSVEAGNAVKDAVLKLCDTIKQKNAYKNLYATAVQVFRLII